MGALLTQRPGQLHLAVVLGDAAEVELEFVDADDVAVNLSAAAWELRVSGATTAVLDAAVVTTNAATGRIRFAFPDSVTARVEKRTYWALRDTTTDRTLLDGEILGYAPGQAGAPSGSVRQTVVVTNSTAVARVTAAVVGGDGSAPTGNLDGGTFF